VVRKLLFSAGLRFRLHRRDLPGSPDIVMPGRRIAIFVHGCFWHGHHGCRLAKIPATRTEFWAAKIKANQSRDVAAVSRLLSEKWRVLIVWECAVRDKATALNLLDRMVAWISGDGEHAEISVADDRLQTDR
jgi:DNA mismatch endonuclease (patch repair protein)